MMIDGYQRECMDRYDVVYDTKTVAQGTPTSPIPCMTGWVCPVCGRGLSPFTAVCPCKNGKGWEITC